MIDSLIVSDSRFHHADQLQLGAAVAAVVRLDEQLTGRLQVPVRAMEEINFAYDMSFTAELLEREPVRQVMLCQLYICHWVYQARCKINRYNAAMSGAHQDTLQISTAELAARVWHGGPEGWRLASTGWYAQRVLQLIAEQKVSRKPEVAP